MGVFESCGFRVGLSCLSVRFRVSPPPLMDGSFKNLVEYELNCNPLIQLMHQDTDPLGPAASQIGSPSAVKGSTDGTASAESSELKARKRTTTQQGDGSAQVEEVDIVALSSPP